MFDTHKSHPLLVQVPLTVSPFISIPTAVTLPYTFRSVPASLPPSVIADTSNGEKPKYVKASSGHAAHPEDMINSGNSLLEHLSSTSSTAQKKIQQWQEGIRERELAEKRRVAPGWLDRDEKLLEPTKASLNPGGRPDLLGRESSSNINAPIMSPSREGEELDRVFGGLDMK